MIFQIDGVNTQNKGAELMLISVLEEIDIRFPKSTVYINPDSSFSEKKYFNDFNLKIRLRPFRGIVEKIIQFLGKVMRRKISINIFSEFYSPENVDIILDASGFKFSDQWGHTDSYLTEKINYYKSLISNRKIIIFLPQAFGPFESQNGIKSAEMISKYPNLVYARDKISFKFLKNFNKKNILKLSPDITLKTKGVFPKHLTKYRNSILLIPNKKMLSHGSVKIDKYLNLFNNLIIFFKSKNQKVVLLNHEGYDDLILCKILSKKNKIEIITDLSAKQTKGFIGSSKFVISSRFHGVASALSQGVPCVSLAGITNTKCFFKNLIKKNV